MTVHDVILLLVTLIAGVFCYMWKRTEIELLCSETENIRLKRLNCRLEQCHVELLREIEKLESVCKFNEECNK